MDLRTRELLKPELLRFLGGKLYMHLKTVKYYEKVLGVFSPTIVGGACLRKFSLQLAKSARVLAQSLLLGMQ